VSQLGRRSIIHYFSLPQAFPHSAACVLLFSSAAEHCFTCTVDRPSHNLHNRVYYGEKRRNKTQLLNHTVKFERSTPLALCTCRAVRNLSKHRDSPLPLSHILALQRCTQRHQLSLESRMLTQYYTLQTPVPSPMLMKRQYLSIPLCRYGLH
jgi:hypothetical protein